MQAPSPLLGISNAPISQKGGENSALCNKLRNQPFTPPAVTPST